jgi:methyl coenzyme M reductase subunit C
MIDARMLRNEAIKTSAIVTRAGGGVAFAKKARPESGSAATTLAPQREQNRVSVPVANPQLEQNWLI